MKSRFFHLLTHASRSKKRLVLVGYDISAMIIALWASMSARLGQPYYPDSVALVLTTAVSIAFGIAGVYYLGIYRIVLRFFDLRTVGRIFFAAAIAAIAWALIAYFVRPAIFVDGISIAVPRSVIIIYCGFLFVLMFMGRYMMASVATQVQHHDGGNAEGQRKVIIYGANPAGISLAESVRREPGYLLCAFVDDDDALAGQVVSGVPIYNATALESLVTHEAISDVLLALPKATRSQRLSAIGRLADLNVQIKTVPSPEEIVSGRFTLTDVRPIDVNDLLRRDPVEPLELLLQHAVEGHCIMITGAGGSIGSEICRQVLRGAPKRIVLFDQSEFALYTIEQELGEMIEGLSSPRPEVVAIVGSILNTELVKEVIKSKDVHAIFHAAAYKHVPLLEHNEVACVENNIFGTLSLVTAAIECDLDRFTMISTDKAVRPENIMGASKRVAESIVQGYARQSTATKFGIVRFGNVLDSSGSVVQLFRRQIRNGGPVTVTHPDVTRFFMSIPEATQLVLQASAMAERGEVFVLDMGEPVKISELAANMIRLSGMSIRDEANPTGDIGITYVGLRPGEKLYEELFIGSEVVPTSHPRIMKANERSISRSELDQKLALLNSAVISRDAPAIRAVLGEVISRDVDFN